MYSNWVPVWRTEMSGLQSKLNDSRGKGRVMQLCRLKFCPYLPLKVMPQCNPTILPFFKQELEMLLVWGNVSEGTAVFCHLLFSPFVNLWPALVISNVLIALGVLENLVDYLHSKHQGTGNSQLNSNA